MPWKESCYIHGGLSGPGQVRYSGPDKQLTGGISRLVKYAFSNLRGAKASGMSAFCDFAKFGSASPGLPGQPDVSDVFVRDTQLGKTRVRRDQDDGLRNMKETAKAITATTAASVVLKGSASGDATMTVLLINQRYTESQRTACAECSGTCDGYGISRGGANLR